MKEEEMSKTCRDLKDKGVMESISSNTSFYMNHYVLINIIFPLRLV